ncbi:unnamed protein product [Thlaspi arvense]|uniref:Uncharacterized protein n=1 Tax=Thlaspi arvense TaxID=13288 RepID=A0AAU9RGM5_THLAR|nr:unnamed protein product [Thlaspi arvense]
MMGMCILTLSATIPAFKPAGCVGSICPSATPGLVGSNPVFLPFGADHLMILIKREGAFVSSSLIVWIQDNAGWGLGTPLYRCQKPGGSPLTRMCQVLVASFHKWNIEVPEDSSLLYETHTSAIEGSRKLDHTDELK